MAAISQQSRREEKLFVMQIVKKRIIRAESTVPKTRAPCL
jgi:hypothetical protein